MINQVAKQASTEKLIQISVLSANKSNHQAGRTTLCQQQNASD